MTPSPFVSVIIPNYNRQTLVATAIESVLSQTWHDFELLVVDDGSRDDSLAVIKGFQDGRVRCLTHASNQGLAAAWNTGVTAAQADLIAFLDSDDTWHPEKLQEQVEFMQQHPVIAGCTTGYVHMRLDGKREVIPAQKDAEFQNILFRNILHMGTTLMVRRHIFEQTGLFDEQLRRGQDTDWLLRFRRVGGLHVVQKPLAIIVQHTQHSAAILEQARINMVEKHWATLQSYGKVFARRKIASMWADVAYQYEREGNREKMRQYAAKSIASFPFQAPGIYLILIDGCLGWRLKQQATRLKRILKTRFGRHL
jgi:glycosyltransferase involved in cell wall biosynthesis